MVDLRRNKYNLLKGVYQDFILLFIFLNNISKFYIPFSYFIFLIIVVFLELRYLIKISRGSPVINFIKSPFKFTFKADIDIVIVSFRRYTPFTIKF